MQSCLLSRIPQRFSPLLAALQWSGVRGALGVAGGRYYFRIKVQQPLPVPAACADADSWPAHQARVGLSAPHAPLGLLGEAPGSYSYDGSGASSAQVCDGGCHSTAKSCYQCCRGCKPH